MVMIASLKAATANPFAALPTLSFNKPDDTNLRRVICFSPAPLFSKLSLGGKGGVVAQMSKDGVGLTYKDAGVDIDAGSELVRRIAKMAPGIGGFGGLFPLGMTLFFSFKLCGIITLTKLLTCLVN